MPSIYRMRGIDDGRPAPGFVTWESRDEPDFAGDFATGLIGSLVAGSAVVQSVFDSPGLQVLYEVDFTALASQTLGDAGSTPTIDGRTWHQVGQAAGSPTHSELINGIGLVVTNNASTGTYRLGINLQDLDSQITDTPRQQRYEVWVLGARSGSPAASSVYGAIVGDATNASLNLYSVGFEGSTPDLIFHSFGTSFQSHATAASNAHDVYHVAMDNRHSFEGRYGDSVSGGFPGFGALTRLESNSGRIDAVSLGDLAAGVYANNITGPIMTYTRMRVVKIEA